jgi:hypothetical protein
VHWPVRREPAGEREVRMKLIGLCIVAISAATVLSPASAEIPPAARPAAAPHDGAHDFDFLIGNWKAHVLRLPDRLVGSDHWVEYNGTDSHRKIAGSNANFEEFEVTSTDGKEHLKAQTLRLYNPDTHQWSIYGLDVDKGLLPMPPVVGAFTGKRGEFYDHESYKGRPIFVRYLWLDLSPTSARMEQAFSADGGKTWETNWICELTRAAPN